MRHLEKSTAVLTTISDPKPSSTPSNNNNITSRLDTEASQNINPKQQGDEASQYISGYKLTIMVTSIALSCFLMLLGTMIISMTIPRITDTFDSLLDIGWYASTYQFGSAAPQLLTGRIYTYFSTKTYITFFGIFELGSLLCGAAVSSSMLIIGRAVAGFGAAGIIIGAITIISRCIPLERRPINQLGLVAGPITGGAFTSYSDWRWCFYINPPIGAVAAVAIVFLRIPEQTSKASALSILKKLHHYLDLIGFPLFAPAVLQLLLALQYGGNMYAWNSSQVIGLFCGSASIFIVWFFWNCHKGDDALLPHSMIHRTAVWASGVYQGFLIAAVYGGIYFLPIYFQAINNASPILSGIYLLPTILPQLFMAASSGVIIMKIEYVIPLAFFSTIFLFLASGLYSLLQPNSSTGEWVGFQIIGGIGSGAGLQVVCYYSHQAVVTEEEMSSAMAFMVFAQSLGPAIALSLYNVIFDTSLKTELARKAPNLNAKAIIDAGATAFYIIVQPEDRPSVLVAYAKSLNHVFYLVAAMAASCGIFFWGMGWYDIRKKNSQEDVGTIDDSKLD
ncbi:efflux pump [Tricladium varicosporioides]|nr:efflux pump [Hymenoscyphus varicosporioides]